MSEPEPAFEKKVLLDVVEQMKDPERTLRRQAITRRTFHAAGTVGATAAFFLSFNGIAHPFVSALLAAMAGCAIGLAIFLQLVQSQWPVTCQHIDMDSIRKRLRELTPEAPSVPGDGS